MFSSFSSSVPLRSSVSALAGHPAPLAASDSASGTSMMISFSVGLASLATVWMYSRPTEPIQPAT